MNDIEVSAMHNNGTIADFVTLRAILSETEVSAMQNNTENVIL